MATRDPKALIHGGVHRCAFLALDHSAYHLGEFAILRQVMQLWPKNRKD